MTRRFTYAIAVFLCLLVSINGFAQGTSNATVGGTVADASGALIPGVTVTATNVGTGIANTVVTNESGAYNFASLQPGDYKVSAELPGFQTQTYTDVKLGGADQVRLNFSLQVAAAAGTNVEVTIAADTVLATSSSVLSTVLPEYKVRDLPALTGNVFNIVQNLPGVQRDGTGTFGYMAGGRLGDVNTTRDGVNVNDGRYENGAWSAVYNSPDMVEEVKVIVAPVDAETSRGSGQVSMVTRSGTNQFRGSVSWSNHNSVLDANDWFNNFNGVGKSYDNRNLYTARLGGPVIKNKTFFFGLFTGQRDMKRSQATGLTLTDMAKAGIFRYWPGVDVLNASNPNPSVDRAGNPVAPRGAQGDLAAIGLFGSCNYKGAPVPNCKVYNLDPNRTSISTHAFLQEELKRMPSPNQFISIGTLTPDGLNTGLISFVRRQDGLDLTNGNGDEVNRDQYNLRIDHNFNSKHKLSFIGTNEHTWGTATQAGLRAWPLGYDGLAVKRPVLYSLQMTSTLSNSMLNQFRISKSGTNNWQWGSADRGDEIGAEARALHARANGIPYQVTFATNGGGTNTLPSFSNIGGFGRWREGINPRYALGDDLSWTKGKHAFKGGYEVRRTESNGFNDPNYDPIVTLGAGGNNAAVLSAAANEGGFTGLTNNAATAAKNLLYDLAGSVTSINQAFGVKSAQDTVLRGTPEIRNNRHWNIQYEMSSYFKDDWKFRNDLTLNLGVHWEWYGMPYEHDGLAARIVGDDKSFLNVACTSTIGVAYSSNCTNLTTVQFVGKNSTHPELGTYVNGNDNNNFAPSVGFAWNLPWFGKGKTVIRSGYGINYEGALRNFITVDGVIGTVPGINHVSGGGGLPFNPTTYTTLNTVTLPIPFPAGTATTSPFLVTTRQRSLGITTYNRVSPYTQNWNFEIQREITKGTTVEIRYVGTKGTKIISNTDLNTLNWIRTDGSKALFEAFNAARQGGESPLLNQLFNGLALAGTCVVNGTTCTGAQVMRTNSTTRAQLANGNFGGFLNALNTGAIGALQYSGQPATDGAGSILYRNGFPDNWLVPSPQYSTVNITGNNDNSTYHSLNLQVTRRLANGFANTTTYIWSKALGEATTNGIDPMHQHVKSLQAVDHAHQISSNGTYELPFGTGHKLLGSAPGWIQNVVNGWQIGGIMNYLTGAPLSITTNVNTITNTSATPNVVGAIPKDFGKVTYVDNGVNYFSGYTQVTDPMFRRLFPQCATSASGGTAAAGACNSLDLGYNNKAICPGDNGVCTGPEFLVNAQPGQVGTLGQTTVRGPSRFDLDMNIVKRFRIDERKQFELRVDAINILNHPNFGTPSTAMNTAGTFGRITSLASGLNTGGNGGMRSFVINTRLNF
jgi:hypothetical protein